MILPLLFAWLRNFSWLAFSRTLTIKNTKTGCQEKNPPKKYILRKGISSRKFALA